MASGSGGNSLASLIDSSVAGGGGPDGGGEKGGSGPVGGFGSEGGIGSEGGSGADGGFCPGGGSGPVGGFGSEGGIGSAGVFGVDGGFCPGGGSGPAGGFGSPGGFGVDGGFCPGGGPGSDGGSGAEGGADPWDEPGQSIQKGCPGQGSDREGMPYDCLTKKLLNPERSTRPYHAVPDTLSTSFHGADFSHLLLIEYGRFSILCHQDPPLSEKYPISSLW